MLISTILKQEGSSSLLQMVKMIFWKKSIQLITPDSKLINFRLILFLAWLTHFQRYWLDLSQETKFWAISSTRKAVNLRWSRSKLRYALTSLDLVRDLLKYNAMILTRCKSYLILTISHSTFRNLNSS